VRHFFRATLCLRGICRRSVSVCLFVCLSICPSQAGVVSKRLDESSLFWHGGFLPQCVIRRFICLQKLRYFLLELCPKLRTFRHHKSIALSTKLVDGRACWRRLHDNRRVVAVYYKSVNCNPLTPLPRFVMDRGPIQFVSEVNKILTDIARHSKASFSRCSYSGLCVLRCQRLRKQRDLSARTHGLMGWV